jgi:hypothetical protein
MVRAVAKGTIPCEACGAPFVPNRRGRPRRFCDGCPVRAEAYKAERRVAHEPRQCSECPTWFVPGRSDRIVCSTSCRWKRKLRLKREREGAA